MTKEIFSILLVDDSDDDRLFVRRAIEKNKAFSVVGELTDGDAAIAYLSGEGDYGDRARFPFPDILLLDLKLPKKTGHEVLEWMQSLKAPNLRVIVLSGSFLPEDITRSEKLGAHGYFKKEAFEEEQQAMLAEVEKIARQAVYAPG
jgi:CheY-like chemotaxis protein